MKPTAVTEYLKKLEALNKPYVILDTQTFINASNKARFIDTEFGEWWMAPKDVLRGREHPQRSKIRAKLKLTLPASEIQKRLNEAGRNITLDQSTYINTKTKARFIDPDFGEWWAKPNDVLNGSGHPKRTTLKLSSHIKARTKDPKEIQDFLQANKKHLVLDESTFKGMLYKARFIDCEFGEWWARPNSVLNGQDHPKRSAQKIKEKLTLPASEVQKRLNESGRNITLDQSTYINTKTKARFIDPDFGEWWAKPNGVLNGSGHPKRAIQSTKKRLSFSGEEIQKRLSEAGRNITLDQSTYINTKTKARFIDPDFGEWWATPANVLKGSCHPDRAKRLRSQKPNDVLNGQNHPKRFFKKNRIESFVEDKLKVLWIGDQKLAGLKYKPDFQINDTLFFNVDGLYWHCQINRPKDYHFKLRMYFEEMGMRILQFREHEIVEKWHIVEGIIKAVAGKTENKIGARKCEAVKIPASEVFSFCEKWHLKGGIMVGGYALKYGNEVLAVIAVKKYNHVLKVERFCVKAGWSVSGGYSRLLNHALKSYEDVDVVQSWVDLRYGDGHSLERMGFKKIRDVLSWEWTDFVHTYNRLQCTANMDNRKLSEREYAKELGFEKIYDAGQRLYEKKLK